MKYYLYISDNKVNTLLGSIPERDKKKLAVGPRVDSVLRTPRRRTWKWSCPIQDQAWPFSNTLEFGSVSYVETTVMRDRRGIENP